MHAVGVAAVAALVVVAAAGRAAGGGDGSCHDPSPNTGLRDLHPLRDSLNEKV